MVNIFHKYDLEKSIVILPSIKFTLLMIKLLVKPKITQNKSTVSLLRVLQNNKKWLINILMFFYCYILPKVRS